MILFGASGHAKVIIDVLLKAGLKVDYLVDSNPQLTQLMGYKVVHDSMFEATSDHEVILSIGNNSVRKKLAGSLNTKFGVAVHPQAVIGQEVEIGSGTVVMGGAVINPSVNIGTHCIINTAASVDHDCNIDDYAHISPNATLCGTVSIGEGTHVGAGATIIPNLNIGKWVTIGAGAVVIADVPDYAVVVGNPGRIIKYNDK